MVCTSQPLAAEAGAEILRKGGNAVDAAVATAACLTVVEPTSNGIGGDSFAIVWMKDKMYGLNSSGPSPESISIEAVKALGHEDMPKLGMVPITVPGAPKAWTKLIERFGNLKLSEVLEPAVRIAREGYPVSPTLGKSWQRAFKTYSKEEGQAFEEWMKVFTIDGRPPQVGQVISLKDHSDTLEAIGKTDGQAFYKGAIADKIEEASKKFGGFIRKTDLEKFEPEWVEPVSVNYKGYDVWEIPPNGQGIIALMGLNIMKALPEKPFGTVDFYHQQFEAMKLAFTDGLHFITDPNHMGIGVEDLLSETYGKKRASLIGDEAVEPLVGEPLRSGTVYLATADKDGNMVSYIQSNYMGFGSGVVIPGTGIAMQNRGHTFKLDEGHVNALKPGKRTYHTIIPGFITKDKKAIGPFGVMGGFMQPQGHLQVIMNMIDYKMNPQDALDAPRWQWVKDKTFSVEASMNHDVVRQLSLKGHQVQMTPEPGSFGRGQIILKCENGVYVGGTESRTDGHIAIL
ncbi:gamma-glutamyltransferase family protein [Acidaminobacter sp. JC074]|nr:gamma-glutamyltransferase family protein [Acidaminobacter sp. JC074]